MLSMLLDARHEDGSPMSDQELRDELMTLLVAGHETTASSLAWAFERLVRDPAVLGTLIPRSTRATARPTSPRRSRRPCAVVRFCPTAAPRLIKKPIEVGGWEYEPGACLVPCSYLLHHDPELYPDPYAFRPERFLDSAPGTYTWTPFGGGRRRCLGAGFALLEMRIVLASRPPQLRAAPGSRAAGARRAAQHHDHPRRRGAGLHRCPRPAAEPVAA